jgi:hypothetical protein
VKKKAPAKKAKAAPSKRPAKPLRDQEEWPRLDLELVEFLERAFQQIPLRPGETKIEDAMYAAGQASVAERCREVYEAQRRGEM